MVRLVADSLAQSGIMTGLIPARTGAAGIANASAAWDGSSAGRKGGSAGSYDDLTVPELRQRAKELGLSG